MGPDWVGAWGCMFDWNWAQRSIISCWRGWTPVLKALVISLWRFVTASFSRWSKWLDIMGLRGGREFQVGSGVIIVAGVAHHKGDGRPELLETFVLL